MVEAVMEYALRCSRGTCASYAQLVQFAIEAESAPALEEHQKLGYRRFMAEIASEGLRTIVGQPHFVRDVMQQHGWDVGPCDDDDDYVYRVTNSVVVSGCPCVLCAG